jgi:hypothetical protein
MKKQIIIIVLLGGSLFLSAQKNSWTIGLYTGVHGQITASVKQQYNRSLYHNYDTGKDTMIGGEWSSLMAGVQHTFSPIPPLELTVKYNIGDNFSITSGIGYRSYYMKAKYYSEKINNSPDFIYHFTTRNDFIQLPIIFQYDIPLKKKGFSLFVQGGIAIDIEVYDREWGYCKTEYYDRLSDKLLSVEKATESFF